MFYSNRLFEYAKKRGLTKVDCFSDGALVNPANFPLGALETEGAILFADLPGFSKQAEKLDPVECTYLLNHFIAWFEGAAGRNYGGIVDKFIGDEIMLVFVQAECKYPPLEAAMHTAWAMLSRDPYGFDPKIGIASGPFSVSMVGTMQTTTCSTIGNTVNLAARCVQSTKGPRSIRIATNDIDRIKSVFKEDKWKIDDPKEVPLKNLSPAIVVDIERTTLFIPNFDYLEEIKQNVSDARRSGYVIKDTN